MSTFKFARDFQTRILALAYQDYDFLIMAHSMVQPDYFTDDILIWFFCKIRDYYLDYQMRIGPDALRNELLKGCRAKGINRIKEADIPAYREVFAKLHEPVTDREYIAEEVATFCRHQAIKAAVLRAPKLLQDEKYEEIETDIRAAVQVGTQVMDLGVQYFVDWPERLRRRHEQQVKGTMPTGITELDRIIGGGLKIKQLGLWMAPTNRGKTIALGQCGKRAVISKHKVIHYTFEMSADSISERYDSSFSTIAMRDLDVEEAILAERLEKFGRMWGNTLLIKEFPTKRAGVAEIHAHIMQCQSLGFDPDLILVDYLDLLKPPQRYKERRDELTAITEELRGMAVDIEKATWSATQSQRAAISMETHTEEHVSEDIGKINTADIAITINQTKEEVDAGIMRLFLAKNRNGPRYCTVEIQTHLDRMCFYEPPKGPILPPSGAATI